MMAGGYKGSPYSIATLERSASSWANKFRLRMDFVSDISKTWHFLVDVKTLYLDLHQYLSRTLDNFDELIELPLSVDMSYLNDNHYARACIAEYANAFARLYNFFLDAYQKGWRLGFDLFDFADAVSKMGTIIAAKYNKDYSGISMLLSDGMYWPDNAFDAMFDAEAGLKKMHWASILLLHRLPSPVVIPFRDSAQGVGAVFDHRTIQLMTGRPTVYVLPDGHHINDFKGQLKKTSMTVVDDARQLSRDTFLMPRLATRMELRSGLVVVTGRGAVSNNPQRLLVQQHRNAFERSLIRNIFWRGQPYIGICGGMWQTQAALMRAPDHLNDGEQVALYKVDSHRGPMPSLNGIGEVVNNIIKHNVVLEPDSLIHDAVGAISFSTNSVHWQAVDQHQLSPYLRGVGMSQGNVEEAIEAVEAMSGRPQYAVQWHPEAFASTNELVALPHQKLFQSLRRDADIFAQHFFVQEELKIVRGAEISEFIDDPVLASENKRLATVVADMVLHSHFANVPTSSVTIEELN